MRVKSQVVNQLVYVKEGSHCGEELRVWSEGDLVLKEYCMGVRAISAAISPLLLAEVIATRKAIFTDSCVSKLVAVGSKGGLVRLFSTRLTSHNRVECLGWGKRFNIPRGIVLWLGVKALSMPLLVNGMPR